MGLSSDKLVVSGLMSMSRCTSALALSEDDS